MVGVIELFHTIDVNGDGELDWDEFAAYMMDAGLARADFAGDDAGSSSAPGDSKQPASGGKTAALGAKEYSPLDLPPRDPKTPLNHLRSNIQQMIWVHDLNAVAYFEAGSDVVYLYALHFDRNDGPRHLSTMRLHTAFQEHVVIGIEYVPNGRRLLITSSVLARGIISVWSVADTRNPVVIRRFEAPGALEMPVWVPSLQCIATSHVLLPRIAPDQKEDRYDSHQMRRVFGDFYRPNTGTNQQFTRANQILLLDLAEKKPWKHKSTSEISSHSKSTTKSNAGSGNEEPIVIRDAIRGVTSLAVFKWANRPLLAIGREDGIISIVDVEAARDIYEFDAHGSGVKTLAYSEANDYLASAGFHSFADESTLDVVIWKRHATTSAELSKVSPRPGAGSLSSLSMKMEEEARLKGHDAPVELLAFVDSKRQLVTVDRSETFLVFSSVMRTPTSAPWECLQRFSALDAIHFAPRTPQTLWSMLAVPETRNSDAVMITAGTKLSFYDYCQVKDRDEELLVFFTYYCNALNVIVGATSAKLLLWRAETGILWRSYSYASIAGVDLSSRRHASRQDYDRDRIGVITAVCVDDRERKIILGDDSGMIRVVNAVNGNVMKQLDPHTGRAAVIALAYVLHGKCVISLSAASELHICDEDQPAGYYVPFGGASPESVLLQSLRFVHKANAASNKREDPLKRQEQQQQRISIVRAVANQVINTIAVLIHGVKRESFIQLWDFELSHALGTCVLPPPDPPIEMDLDEEITAFSLLASSGDVVAGTSRGRVLLWPDPGQTPSTSNSTLVFPRDLLNATGDSISDPAESARGAIIYVSTLAIEESPSDLGKVKETEVNGSRSSQRALSISTKEWASMFVRNHSIDDRISSEQRLGVFVVTGDDQGFVSVWIVRRSYRDDATMDGTFMTHADIPTEFSVLPSTFIDLYPGMAKRRSGSARTKRKVSGSNNKSTNTLQHGETVIGFDTIEALFHHAKRQRDNLSASSKSPQSSSATQERRRVERLEAILCQSWRAHDEAIASLELSDDPRIVMTSSASGKVKIWSLDAQLLGIIDQRATRRAPTSHSWAFPVDMNERRRRQESEASMYLSSKQSGSSHGSVAAAGRVWKSPLRASVLQERLSLSDGELRELTHPREVVAAEKKGHHRPVQLRQSDVGRAIRNFVLHQAAPSSDGRPGRKPSKLPSSSDASDDEIPLRKRCA